MAEQEATWDSPDILGDQPVTGEIRQVRMEAEGAEDAGNARSTPSAGTPQPDQGTAGGIQDASVG